MAGEALSPLAAVYLVAALLNSVVAVTILLAAPRKLENWLVSAILWIQAATAVAMGFATSAGENVWLRDTLYGYATSISWGAAFLITGVALWYPRRLVRTRKQRTLFCAGAILVAAGWIFVVLNRPMLYESAYHGPLEGLDWFVLGADTLKYWALATLNLSIFGRAILRTEDPDDRAAELLFAAFFLGVVATLPQAVQTFATMLERGQLTPTTWSGANAILGLAGTIAVSTVIVVVVRGMLRRGRSPRIVLTWFAVAFSIGLLTWAGMRLQIPILILTGNYGMLSYLVARPILLGYAMLEHRILHVPTRLRQGVSTTILVLLSAALFLPVERLVREYSGLPEELAFPAALAAGLGVTLLAFQRIQEFSRATTEKVTRAVREEDSRYLEERRRQLYRVALERNLDERLSLTPHGDAELADLRQSLALGEEEHESMLHEVRARVQQRYTPSGPAIAGTRLLGRYRVKALLGEGGGGRTYLCDDERLGRDVALKEIDSRHGARKGTLHEARLLARVRHPNVVTLHDVHEVGPRAFLVMEHVAGGSLAARLQATGPLPAESARRVLADLLAGLDALHRVGLIHRDVKPSNLLLESSGGAKLADLGVARRTDALTMTGLARPGTPLYMAPEQVLDHDVDARTDVYAAGALLYECLAGESYLRPALREGVLAEEAIVSLHPPLPLEGAPEWANRFLVATLSKDPARRPASARDALALLDAAARPSSPKGAIAPP